MELVDREWVCDKCINFTRAGKQQELDKPRPSTESETSLVKHKMEESEMQVRKNDADAADQEEQEEREKRNDASPRG